MSNRYLIFISLVLFLFSAKIVSQNITIEGKVSDKYDAIPGAKVAIEGLPISTITDIDGNYILELNAVGTYTVVVSFITYDTKTKKIEVKEGRSYKYNFNLSSQTSEDEQFTLGSRAEPRTSLESTSPVDIISEENILNSGQIELGGLLHNLLTSFHSTQQTISDGTDHIDPASLRGLGPDQILVLINGKRRHNSSLLNVNGTVGKGSVGTDFNAIPISAIKRIEVLRDGATSQYGSDAIAGVINIILKHQNTDIVIDARAHQNIEGDGTTIFGSTNFGFNVGKEGFINVTTEIRDRQSTNRAGNYTGNVFSENEVEDNQLIEENDFFPRKGLEGNQVMRIGVTQTQNISLALNSEFKIADKTNVRVFGLKNYREGKSYGFYRFPFEEQKVVASLYPFGFLPEILSDIQDDEVSFGLNTEKNDWNIDFGYTMGVNRLDFSVSNSNNASLGDASPTFFDIGGYFYEQSTSNVDISRSFPYMKGLNIAFGGELSVENYRITAGDETSYINGGETYIDAEDNEINKIPGAQVFPGIRPINELNKFRTNSSFYLDVETKLDDQFLINAAGRYEAYSDYGGQGIYKFAARYKLKNVLNFRLGVSSGFRAPSLHQVFFNNTSTQIDSGESLQVGTFNNESAVAEAFNIERLKPELSNHFTFGFTSRFKNNLTLAFDFYSINIKDRIVLSGRIGEGFENVLLPFGVNTAQFLTNAADTRTIGGDAVINYSKNIGKGKLKSSLSANFNTTEILSPLNVPSTLTGEESTFFSREEIARIETSQPKSKVIFSNSFQIEKANFTLNNIYFGEVTFLHSDDGDAANWQLNEFTGLVETRDQTFSPKILTNISITYKILNNLDLSVYGNNIFDIYPDKLKHSVNTENGNFIYSRRVQQFGILGANFSIKMLLKL